MSSQQLTSVGIVLGVALATYVGIENTFTGRAEAVRGYFLLMISIEASLVILWLLALYRTLPWFVALGRTAATVTWVVSLAGYRALGMGSFGDLRWAVLFLVPTFAVVAEWEKQHAATSAPPIIATSRLFPLFVSLSLTALAFWLGGSARADTRFFLLASIFLSLLGIGDRSSKPKVEGNRMHTE